MFPALIPLLTSILPSVFDKLIPGDTEAVKTARMNFELRKAEIDKSIIDKLGDIDVQQAATNAANAASGSFLQSGPRVILFWALVVDFIVRVPLTSLMQFVNAFSGHIFNAPVYSNGDLVMTLLTGLLGLSLVYSRYKEKQSIIQNVAGAIVAQLPSKLAEAGPTGKKNADGKSIMRDNNGVEYVYKD
jgi:hypothetical protein